MCHLRQLQRGQLPIDIQNARQERCLVWVVYSWIYDGKAAGRFGRKVSDGLKYLARAIRLASSSGPAADVTGDKGAEMCWRRHKERRT